MFVSLVSHFGLHAADEDDGRVISNVIGGLPLFPTFQDCLRIYPLYGGYVSTVWRFLKSDIVAYLQNNARTPYFESDEPFGGLASMYRITTFNNNY